MKHLYFVRHGLSVMNQLGVFSGRTETPLTPEGIAQCHAAGQQLRSAGIQVIVSSPIKRAYDSASIIAEEIGFDPTNIITSDLLVERSFGPLEGTRYHTGADLDGTEGVEHSKELIARVRKALDLLESIDADTILVVSHGAVGRALRSLVQPDTPFHGSERFDNAEVVKLL
jgi:probable phosphoglycerate mutase